MQPLRQFAPTLIADVLRRQPPSPARTTFAWQVVVGPALARTAGVELVKGTLYVRALDARWATELQRAEPAVLERMQRLLGPDQIRRIKTSALGAE
jgi:predicted nucleic acid-binding Zn ribbon protein